MASQSAAHRLVLVTGPSGGGRSTAIKALEDSGFEAIDNLPLGLFQRLFAGRPLAKPVALGVDVRNRDFSVQALSEALDWLDGRPGLAPELLYLDCRPEVLLRRFNETRRRHPIAEAANPLEGIKTELALLTPLRQRADVLIDTSDLSPHGLRAEIERWFAPDDGPRLGLTVHSFSYKRGVPQGLDMVIDCRFLRNPHWEENLRALTGLDPSVGEYIREDPRYRAFEEKLKDMLTLLLPAYSEEGRSHFSIGFGCTGGQHRSVYVAESVAALLAQLERQVSIRHRELDRQKS